MILFEAETLEERERHFREAVMTKNHEIKMDESVLENFMDIWTQETTYKKEKIMLWEKRLKTSAFDIGKRMAYWKRNNPPKDERAIITHPSDLYGIKDPDKLMAAKRALREQGWKYEQVKVSNGTTMKWIGPK